MATKMNAVDSALWITERTRAGQPLALTITKDMCRFFDGEDSVRFDATKTAQVEAMKGACTGSHGVSLIVADLPYAASYLAQATGLTPAVCGEWIIGDMQALDIAIGTSYRELPADDILRTWKATRGMALPGYYEKIAVPAQRMKVRELKEGEPWSVTYSNLLAKVIAKYTMEPLLLRDNPIDDPIDNLRDTLAVVALGDEDMEEPTYEDAVRLLMRAALQEGAITTEEQRLLDLHLPVVQVRISETLERAYLQGEANTLYGRVLPVKRDTPPQAILRHVLVGTALDIINVAAVTFANNGASVSIPSAEGTEGRIKISGTCRKREAHAWLKTLVSLASVGGPLLPVRLNPVVISE